MNSQNSRSSVAARRGELLAELFFQDLDPVFISRPTTQDVGYDLLVGFLNENAGINTFAIQVKSTERVVGSHFSISRSVFDRIAHSNVPGFLFVADVKRNRLYYGRLTPRNSAASGNAVSVPVIELNEIAKGKFKKLVQKAEDGVLTVG